MKKQFYTIVQNLFNNDKYAYGEDFGPLNTGNAQHCIGCNKAISFLEWLPPYNIKISAKSKLADLIFGTYEGFIASKRFINLYQLSGLKGLNNFRKVDLFFRKKPIAEEYYYLNIININASIDLSKIDCTFHKPMCSVCQIGYNSINGINGIIFLDPKKITQDIFCSTVTGGAIIVSQKFKDFVDANDFTNIELIKAEDYKSGNFDPPDLSGCPKEFLETLKNLCEPSK